MKSVLFGVLLAIFGLTASAHEMRPAIASMTLNDQGLLAVELVVNLEAWLADIDPSFADTDDSSNAAQYDSLRALPPSLLAKKVEVRGKEFTRVLQIRSGGKEIAMKMNGVVVLPVEDGSLPRDTKLSFGGKLPSGAKTLSYAVDASLPNTAVRLFLPGTAPQVQFVKTGQTSDELSLDRNITRAFSTVIFEYIELGFTHILPKGLDHIIFILGLTLISKRFTDLLIQVTAFTLAHSVTLALGLYGVVSIAPSIVEPLIAASIIYIAVENIWHQKVHVSRALIVFLFGLLHGLGFAGVLKELGLPEQDFVLGLLSFNVGVEIGQLAVITLAYLIVGFWTIHKPWYQNRIARPASGLIGVIGVYWLIERLAG